MFSKSSRYYGLPERTWSDAQGRKIVYKSIRLLQRTPARAENMTLVAQSERLDLVAARTLGRPDFFWKLCEVNHALDPFALIETSERRLWVPEV